MNEPLVPHEPIAAAPVELRASTMPTADRQVPNRYHLAIAKDWTIVHVFGGVSMYCLLRAMSVGIARPELEVQQMTTLFVAPVPAAELVADVEILRAGRRTVHVSADLRAAGSSEVLARAHAVFGTPDEQRQVQPSIACPLAPLPAELITRPHNPEQRFPMDERTDWRPVDQRSGTHTTLAWERLREGEVHREAVVIFGDILGAAVEATSANFVLSLEISMRFIHTPATPWVLQEAEVWHASSGYVSGPARLWDERGNLCAIVNQTALLRPAPQG